MATMTRTDSGSVSTYVITDMSGNTLTVAATVNTVTGNTVTFTSSGGLMPDGLAMLWFIIGALTTGIIPVAQNQTY